MTGYFLACTGLTRPATASRRGFPASLAFTGLLAGAVGLPAAARGLHRWRCSRTTRRRCTASTTAAGRGCPAPRGRRGRSGDLLPLAFFPDLGRRIVPQQRLRQRRDRPRSKQAWEQTSRAQATTVIPTRAEAGFHDLLRFEPYPDPRVDPIATIPRTRTHCTRGA